jgi:hypothetical protein
VGSEQAMSWSEAKLRAEKVLLTQSEEDSVVIVDSGVQTDVSISVASAEAQTDGFVALSEGCNENKHSLFR